MIFWFGIGYLTHWVADSMTISGVPISPYDKHKIHLFGGKLRTGDMGEYIISFSLLAVAVFIIDYKDLYNGTASKIFEGVFLLLIKFFLFVFYLFIDRNL